MNPHVEVEERESNTQHVLWEKGLEIYINLRLI
jgi:hypothetical protein